MKKIHHFTIFVIIMSGSILFLLFHHGVIHDGVIVQVHDFDGAIFYLLKSHEGIILLITLVLVGSVLGHSKWISKK